MPEREFTVPRMGNGHLLICTVLAIEVVRESPRDLEMCFVKKVVVDK